MKNFTRNILHNLLLLAFCIINGCTSISEDNFIVVDHLSDNEKETRLKWKDLMGKETTLDMDDEARYANSSLKLTSLWQLTNGKNFAQFIYSGQTLIDCEILDEGGEITDNFVDKFIGDFNALKHFRSDHTRHHLYQESSNLAALDIKPNFTLIYLKKLQEIPEHFLQLMNLKSLKKKCNQLHKSIRQAIKAEDMHDDEDMEDFGTVKQEKILSRTKRQTDSWFIAPNTKWCGKGRSAEQYKELGPSKSDVCCRRHDHCKLSILSFQSKFGVFNRSPFTMSHCKCDRRFRTCLKMADASDANMVGKLFFNIVQIKCFVLKPEKSCILYSWWGKCLKFKTKKKAYIRENKKY